MNKLAATNIISLSLVCICAQIAVAQPDNQAKRSLAMTPLPLAPAPHAVPHLRPSAKPVTRAMLKKKAAAAYPRTHFDKGQYFKSKGDVDAALVEFLKSSQQDPRLVRAFYEQALIFRQRHYLKLADSSLEQALAVKPDYQEARILLATIRIEQGNLGAAMQELSRSLGLQLPGSDSGTKGNTSASAQNTTPGHGLSQAAPKTAHQLTPIMPQLDGIEQLLAKAPAVLQSVHTTLAELPARFIGAPAPAKTALPPAKTLINPALSGSQPTVSEPAPKSAFSLRRYPELPPKPPATAAATAASRSSRTAAAKAAVASPVKTAMAKPAKAITAQEKPAKEAEATRHPDKASNEQKTDDDVFVLRIPKSIKFFWQHKQPPQDSTQQRDEQKDLASKTKRANNNHQSEHSQGDRGQTKQDKTPENGSQQTDDQSSPAKHEGKSWLFHFFHAGADDTADNSSAPSNLTAETAASKNDQTARAVKQHKSKEAKSSSGSDDAAAGHNQSRVKHQVARKPTEHEEIKQFVQPPPPPSRGDTADSTTERVETALAGKPLTFEPADASEAPEPQTESTAPLPSAASAKTSAFALPELPSSSSQLLAPLNKISAANNADDDQWTTRLKYLAAHGNGSLKEGEAFMFAEDSGEATLFLSDGQTIRRKIAAPRDAQEIVRERRPDMLIPDEIMYNLSLLGKLMPKFGETEPQPQTAPVDSSGAPQPPEHNFKVDNLMGDSQSFWGWLKHVFKL